MSGATCPAEWPEISRLIKGTDAGVPDAAADGAPSLDSGSDSVSSDAGAGAEPMDHGCGCDVPRRSASSAAIVLAALAIMVHKKRRTRP